MCLPAAALAQPSVVAPPFETVNGSFFAISVSDLGASSDQPAQDIVRDTAGTLIQFFGPM